MWDGAEWLEGNDAIDFILNLSGDSARLIPNEALFFEPETDRQTSGRSREPKTPDDVQFAKEALTYLGQGVKAENGREYLGEYSSWLTIGMALYDLGDVGRELWEAWSKQSSKYETDGPNSCAAKWKTFSVSGENGVSLGTIFHQAKANGWPGFPKSKDPDELDETLAKRPAPTWAMAKDSSRGSGPASATATHGRNGFTSIGQRWKEDDTAAVHGWPNGRSARF